MPKDKERSVNPAAAQRKLEKQKAVKKGKAAVAAQRTERFASRNPTRLESQISDLHALRDSHGGNLNARDKKHLEDLERDVARIKKARDTLGDRAPQFGGNRGGRGGSTQEGRGDRQRGGYHGLGKRRRGDDDNGNDSDSEETDEEVRRIPWPRDTPPPIPRRKPPTPPPHRPLQDRDGDGQTEGKAPDTSLPAKPPKSTAPPPRTTYESKAQVRDLRAEATRAFVPGVVKKKMDAVRGTGAGGKLLEEEDLERLEREGYKISGQQGSSSGGGDGGGGGNLETVKNGQGPGGVEIEDEQARRLREEEEAFEREIADAEGGGGGSEKDEEDRGAGMGQSQRWATVEDASDQDA